VHVNRVLRELRRDGMLEQVGAFDPLYLHQKPQL